MKKIYYRQITEYVNGTKVCNSGREFLHYGEKPQNQTKVFNREQVSKVIGNYESFRKVFATIRYGENLFGNGHYIAFCDTKGCDKEIKLSKISEIKQEIEYKEVKTNEICFKELETNMMLSDFIDFCKENDLKIVK